MVPSPAARAAALALLLLAACDPGGTLPLSPLTVSTSGTAERSATVAVLVRDGSTTVPPGEVTLAFTPAAGAELVGPGQARLLRAGTLEIRAAYRGRTGTVTVQVAAPPSVAFDMLVNGNRDLYRVALDGGDFVRLTTDPGDDRDPSAAAGDIVFSAYRGANADLFVMADDGGPQTRITTTAAAETSPALSPDGQRIACAYDASGVSKVWTMTIAGQNAARAAPGFGFDGAIETAPTWAPGPARLAFVATPQGSADVFQVAPGGTPALLAGSDAADVDPAWSPDGQWVAFASTRDGDAALYLVRATGGTPVKLTDRAGSEAEPAWTPDGRLVYVEFAAGGATSLRWLDPAAAGETHTIPLPVAGAPRRPTGIP